LDPDHGVIDDYALGGGTDSVKEVSDALRRTTPQNCRGWP
jgi:hypothetical protein